MPLLDEGSPFTDTGDEERLGVLFDIAAEVRADVDRDRVQTPLDVSLSTRTPHGLAPALRAPGVHVIAEVKRASPSLGSIAPGTDVPATAAAFIDAGAAAVSILTEPRHFGGSRETLIDARRRNPGAIILMKDFVVDTYQIDRAFLDGADVVLLIVALLGESGLRTFHDHARRLGLSCLVEVHDEAEMAVAARTGAELIGVNNRDLRTLQVSLDTSRRLAAVAPGGAVLISESGIECGTDIRELRDLGYGGFLVGTSLMRENDPVGALRRLLEDAA